jgi:hypothetical protein
LPKELPEQAEMEAGKKRERAGTEKNVMEQIHFV